MLNTSSVRPSGLKAVVTAWPATNSGRFGRPGFRLWNVAPGAACGVIEAPVGRRTGLPLTCWSLCCRLEPGLGLDGALHPAQPKDRQTINTTIRCVMFPPIEKKFGRRITTRGCARVATVASILCTENVPTAPKIARLCGAGLSDRDSIAGVAR